MSSYIKVIRNPQHIIRPVLSHLDIELTERCNNNCIHCCVNQPEHDDSIKAKELSTEQVKNILSEAADLGCMRVRFTGGEPLLRSDFEELYLFARRLGIGVLIFTNARLINERLADLFVRIPPRNPLEVTVYGMNQMSYEAVSCTPGSFDEFWRGVNLLLARGIPFYVKSAWLPPNKKDRIEFESWASGIPWMDHIPEYAMFFDLRVRRDDPIKNKVIQSLRVSPEESLQLMVRDPDAYRSEMEIFKGRFMGPPGDLLFRCGAGSSLWIDAYGKAQPCSGVRAPELTVDLVNSSNRSLRYALDKFKQLRKMKASNLEYLRRCAECFLKGLCEQCPGKSWTEHGNLDTPVEYLCDVAHTHARWLGWLGEKQSGWEVNPLHHPKSNN